MRKGGSASCATGSGHNRARETIQQHAVEGFAVVYTAKPIRGKAVILIAEECRD